MIKENNIGRIIECLSDPSYMRKVEERIFESGCTNFDSIEDAILMEDVGNISFNAKRHWSILHFGKLGKAIPEIWLDPDHPKKGAQLPDSFFPRYFVVNTYNVKQKTPTEIRKFLARTTAKCTLADILKRLNFIVKNMDFVLAVSSNLRMIFFSGKKGKRSMVELRYSKRLYKWMKSHSAEHHEGDDAVVPAATQEKTPKEYQVGAEKYKDEDRSSIAAKENFVKGHTSLNYTKFEEEPLNLKKVISETKEHNRDILKQTVSRSNSLCEKAFQSEPKITKDLVDLAKGSGASMYGLGFRIKQKTSLTSKILKDRHEDIIKGKTTSIDEIAAKMYDVIRYTIVFPFDRLAAGYESVRRKMKKMGYTEMRCKNYYVAYEKDEMPYKAIQSVFCSPDNTFFELQFHTTTTLGVKEVLHPLYEKWRADSTPVEEKQILQMRMKNLSAVVKNPPRILSIKEFNLLKMSDEELESWLKRRSSDKPKMSLGTVKKLGLTGNDEVDIIAGGDAK